MHRFLHRVWRNLAGEGEAAGRGSAMARRRRNSSGWCTRTIKAVTESMEQLEVQHGHRGPHRPERRDAAVARLPRASADAFVLMLAPLAPHLAEELWWRLGHAASLAHERWPEWDDHVLADAQVEIPVQVMGRVRGHVTVAADADAAAVERAALADAKVRAHITGKTIRRVIVVPGKLVNIVTG